MQQEFYEMEIAGLKRQLPVCKVNDELSIAGFIMFSDVEITVACAKALLEKIDFDFDIILTAEAKGIPLAYEMARQSGKNYVVARKMNKLYMKNPIMMSVKSITTERVQTLYLDQTEIDLLKTGKILIVDDVISTGGSLHAMEALIAQSKGTVVAKAAVLAEGDAADRDDIVFLEKLPLFFT